MHTPRTFAVAFIAALCVTPALTASPVAAASDLVYGATWTADPGTNTISEYAPSATGAAAPIATIHGGATGLHGPSGVAVGSKGSIFVSNAGNNSITEYKAGSAGDVAPIATIKGANTGLAGPSSIALAGGDLWVTDPATNLVEAFTGGTGGNELPAETIAGHRTGLDHPVGVTTDNAAGIEGLLGIGGIYVINAPASGSGNLMVFSTGKLGDVAPGIVITSSRKGPLKRPTAIVSAGLGEVWVTDGGSNAVSEFTAFAGLPGFSDEGFGEPVRTISGSATHLNQPSGLGLDALGGPVVANAGDHTVRVFSGRARGDVAPVRTISSVGADSGSPAGAAVLGAAPGAPTDFRAVMHRHSQTATLSWHPPAFTGGGVIGYQVLALDLGSDGIGDIGGAFSEFIGISELGVEGPVGEVTTTKTTYTKKHLKLGVNYLFVVQAVNAFGVSPAPHPAHGAFVIAASAPRHVTAAASKHSVALHWLAPHSDGGRPLTAYRIEYATCRPGAKGCGFHSKIVPGHRSFAIVHGLTAGTKYYLRIAARTGFGLGTPSRVVAATPTK